MINKKCFGFSAECSEDIIFYYKERTENCSLSKECYDEWIKSGGQINGNFEWCNK